MLEFLHSIVNMYILTIWYLGSVKNRKAEDRGTE